MRVFGLAATAVNRSTAVALFKLPPDRSPGLTRDHANALSSEFEQALALKDQRLAGFDDQPPGASTFQILDGARPDGGYVKAHVLIRFGDFDERPTALWTKLPGTLDQPIGALDRFNGNDLTFLDRDRLADIQPAISLAMGQAKSAASSTAAGGGNGVSTPSGARAWRQ